MTATWQILATLAAVFVGAWWAQAFVVRAAARAAFDRHVAEAVEAADWSGDPTPTHDWLLAEVRYLPLQEAMGRLLVADVEAWRREGER